MAVVADMFDRFPSAVPIFAAVVDVLAGDVPQNDRSFPAPPQRERTRQSREPSPPTHEFADAVRMLVPR